jgi:cytochrome c biogenesis protein CcmG/thiol:disulfide interchange protein DsbE
MKNLKLFIPLFIFIGLAVLLLKGLDRDPNALPSALIGEPVPAFRLPNLLTGEQVSEDVFQGHVTLLNVWATWCPSCRMEHPFLLRLAREQGVRIVGMDYKDEDADATAWLDKLGNPYELVFADANGHLGVDLGVYGAPETYLIDHKGIIRAKRVGVVDERVWAELGATYRQLVSESGQ